MKKCAQCECEYSSTHFSKNQWKKAAGTGRCIECVAAGDSKVSKVSKSPTMSADIKTEKEIDDVANASVGPSVGPSPGGPVQQPNAQTQPSPPVESDSDDPAWEPGSPEKTQLKEDNALDAQHMLDLVDAKAEIKAKVDAARVACKMRVVPIVIGSIVEDSPTATDVCDIEAAEPAGEISSEQVTIVGENVGTTTYLEVESTEHTVESANDGAYVEVPPVKDEEIVDLPLTVHPEERHKKPVAKATNSACCFGWF